MFRTPIALLFLLLLPALAGCLRGPAVPAHTTAQEAAELARKELPDWDLVYLAAGGSLEWAPGKSETWSVGMAREGQVAIVIVRGDGVRVSMHPLEDRIVHGGEVIVWGPWYDGGAPPPLLGEGWRGLEVMPEPEALHWMAFLHGEEPRWERILVREDGQHRDAHDARSGVELPPTEGLSTREAVAQWRKLGGEGEVTGLFGIDDRFGFASADHRLRDNGTIETKPLLVVPGAAGDGQSSQWLLASGNATWRVDATGAVRLDDGLLDAWVPLGDWADSTAVAGHFDHSGGLFLHAYEPHRPFWANWNVLGDTIERGSVDARPVPVLRLQGTVWESGRTHPPFVACGVSLPVVEVDEASRRIEYRDDLPVHADHDLFVVDGVDLVLLDSDCHQVTLRSGNGTVTTPWDGLAVAVEEGGVRVGEILLRPGDTANVTVHWSVTETRHGEEGTWDYDGVLRVTWLGTWPRGNITPTL